MTGIPFLNRSATSRASLNRRGSDLWIADAEVAVARGDGIVRTMPSASTSIIATSRTGWER